MLNIISKRKIWYLISIIMIVPGLVSLLMNGLKLGLDFKGGTLIELQFIDQKTINTEDIRSTLAPLNLGNLVVQSSGTNSVIIRTDTLSVENEPVKTTTETDQTNTVSQINLINYVKAQTNDLTIVSDLTAPTTFGGAGKYKDIVDTLVAKFGPVKELRFEAIGPTVSKELTNKTILGVLIASLCIILYIAWAFRNVPAPTSSWRFGICAVGALLHDVLFILGIYSLLGVFYNVEIDILFLPAILTVMSFSVHDTIVVFDRVRENLRKYSRESFENVVNMSVNETLVRSLNVSLVVIVTLFSLYLFGSASIKTFILTLIIGLISGTYSSIFNASPLLVSWHNWSNKK